jgi:prolyl-tRNA editing enzyme YbaK/EbsC (Cys-tRNA(Pro) deacylase)
MQFGTLTFEPVTGGSPIAAATKKFLQAHPLKGVLVSAIDPTLSDTAAFCEAYQVTAAESANCVILEAKRGDRTWYAACLVLATTRADVNGIVRRELDAKKLSFAPMDRAVTLTGMEFGGITPLGLPADWPILVDEQVAAAPHVIIGSGVRGSKLLVPGELFRTLPGASVLAITKE